MHRTSLDNSVSIYTSFYYFYSVFVLWIADATIQTTDFNPKRTTNIKSKQSTKYHKILEYWLNHDIETICFP
jgi:hypothetical protein